VFGHKWEPAEGTVVECRPDEMALAGTTDQSPVHVYVVDVRKANGQVERATVRGSAGMPLAVGTMVRLEINAKTGEARFDPSARNVRTGSVRDAIRLAEQVRHAQRAGGGAAAVAAALSGMPQGIGIQQAGPGQPGGPGMRVVSGGEAAELMQELLSGNAGDRAAAIEKLQSLRSQAAGQAGTPDPMNPSGGFNPPPTFDQVGGFNAPPTPSSFGPVGGFNTPPAPSSFDPVGGFNPPPAPSFDPVGNFDPPPAPSSFDQAGNFDPPPIPNTFDQAGGFGTSGSFGQAGQSSAADRIAKLQGLRDKGLITPSEFDVQRQRILDEI
jgi:hypothetical protein